MPLVAAMPVVLIRSPMMRTAPRSLPAPGEEVTLTFSPDGKVLAATAARITQLWEIATGKLQRTLPGLGASSYGSTFSPDGAW